MSDEKKKPEAKEFTPGDEANDNGGPTWQQERFDQSYGARDSVAQGALELMAVDASLDALRKMIGAKSTGDDDLLQWALDAAHDVIRPEVYPDLWNRSNVQQAVLFQANRYYRRRLSATGVEGFGPEGFSVRVTSIDWDIKQLLGKARNMKKVGLA